MIAARKIPIDLLLNYKKRKTHIYTEIKKTQGNRWFLNYLVWIMIHLNPVSLRTPVTLLPAVSQVPKTARS